MKLKLVVQLFAMKFCCYTLHCRWSSSFWVLWSKPDDNEFMHHNFQPECQFGGVFFCKWIRITIIMVRRQTSTQWSCEWSSTSNHDIIMYSTVQIYTMYNTCIMLLITVNTMQHMWPVTLLKQQTSNLESFSLHSQSLLEQPSVDAILEINLTAMERNLQSGREEEWRGREEGPYSGICPPFLSP